VNKYVKHVKFVYKSAYDIKVEQKACIYGRTIWSALFMIKPNQHLCF